ncbi:DUF3592 domain-containing protein [Streptomyces morookaense]|uniref:DUF3592 domain-containing protein n=1 Tax=Streptomyces morookaense TaxID=1970 RepID=UPI0033C6E916
MFAAFEFLFPAIPGLMAAGSVAGIVGVVRKQRRFRAAWTSGIELEARCVRSYIVNTTTMRGHRPVSSSSHHKHVYEFTDADGQRRRFEEAGPATVFEGDTVVVRHPPGRPDRATAVPPGDRGTRAGARVRIGFLCIFTLISVTIATLFFTIAHKMTEPDDNRPPAIPPLPSLPSGPPPGFPTGFPTDFPDPPAPR